MPDQKDGYKQPAALAGLGLQALANYVASGLVRPGETMHRDLAVRLAEAVNRNEW